MYRQASIPSLFPAPPVLAFRADQQVCPNCQQPLKVLKTQSRWVATLHLGRFVAKQTLLHCNACADKRVYSCRDLDQLVPRHCQFGYDVMIRVGKALFLEHRTNREIIDHLARRNIAISASEVDYLGKRFIVTLAIAHRQQAAKIKRNMHQKGGYILHLDGTCEGDSPMLMTGLDSVSKIVLGSVKLPSEKAASIIPFLKQLIAQFGKPLAVVHDMGPGILKAVSQVLPGIADFICHFHFLRDIGKDLFEAPYGIIRNRLTRCAINTKLQRRCKRLEVIIDQNPGLIPLLCDKFNKRSKTSRQSSLRLFPIAVAYILIQWALDGKKQGHGYGFPFDQPLYEFAKRLCTVYDYCNHLKKQSNSKKVSQAFAKIVDDLKPFVTDPAVGQSIDRITTDAGVFLKLRKAMKIAPETAGPGLNDDGMDQKIGTIEKRVTAFHQWLIRRNKSSNSSDYGKMIAQLEKYWEKLFADPIQINTADGIVKIQPQRTNNILERFFRDLKRSARKKTGHKSMKRTLQSMLTDMPLVKNLENREYVQVLLDGKGSLEELFASIDKEIVKNQMQNAASNSEKLDPTLKKIIAHPKFSEIIMNV